MSNIVVTYEKVKSYDMPENNWTNVDEWFKSVTDNISNLNHYNDLNRKFGLKVNRGCQTGDNLYDALASRIKNKNTTEGNYGYGKVFENIIGEYLISIDDKTVIEQKVKTLAEILKIINNDEQLVYYDPKEELEKKDLPLESKIEVDISKVDLENEVRLAVLLSFNAGKGKVKAGQVIGRLVNKFPTIMKERAKEVGPQVGKGIGMIGAEIRKLGDGGAKKLLDTEFPDYEKYLDVDKEGPKKLEEPLEFYFGGGDLKPITIYYDIGDEQYGISLDYIIRKMKHDKKAYQELNLIKPGGGKWPQSGGGQFYMVMSNDPFMNMCKSTGRYWSGGSCESYGSSGQYPQGPVSDIWFGNLIVYLFKGDRPSDGWPYKQSVGSGWQNKVDAAPNGTLLSRQNVKWGYKENKPGDIGAGIDPGHYPSNGRKGYQANSNRAIAMVLAEHGLFNYTSLKTPYYYKGHCDVGAGTGNLTYTSGTSCFTRIDQMNFNPDLIVAENPNISYYDFNRLTKPATDRKVKLLLAKNHTIWAIPENDKGINRLLQTNDKEIISLMIASPIATKYGLNYVLDNLELIQGDSKDYNQIPNNLAKIISKHPNADDEIHNKLIEKHPDFDNGLSALEVFYIFGNLIWSNETFISQLPKDKLSQAVHQFLNRKLIDKDVVGLGFLLNLGLNNKANEMKVGKDGLSEERKTDIIISSVFAKNMMFAKNLSIKDYTKILTKFKGAYHAWDAIKEHHDKYPNLTKLVNETANELGYSYCIPLYDKKHYGWNFESERVKYDFSSIQDIELNLLKTDRQTVGNLNNIYNICPELFETGTIIEYIRSKKVYDKLWTLKDKYNIDPYYFTLNPRHLENHDKEDIAIYWDERKLEYAFENTNKPLRAFMYKFLPYDESNNKPRERIHSSLLNTILNSDEYIKKLGIEVICHWIYGDLKFFKMFEDKILKIALRDLYEGGVFKDPPKDYFKLYENVEDISIITNVAVGTDGKEGGLCRNPNIPYYIQKCLLHTWPNISKKYEGEYDQYYNIIENALSQNPGTHKEIIKKLYENEKYWKNLASNPATPERMLSKLYREYPVEVLCNPSLSDKLFNNFWRLTNNILRKEVDVNVNRLDNLFKQPNDKISGVKRRKQIIQYLQESINWIGYWRGGNTKKGNYSQFSNNNYYHEGIADYPVISPLVDHKVVILKFCDDKNRNMENELWIINNFEVIGKNHVKISGKMYDGKGLIEFKDKKLLNNELFSHIPKYKRTKKKIEKDDEGNEIIIAPNKWTFDNIFVFTDKHKPKGEVVPNWRYSWDKTDLEKILNVFVNRQSSKEISKLLNDWNIPYTVASGLVPKADWANLNQECLIKAIDDNKLWTPELVGVSLISLLKNNSKNYTLYGKNLPLSKTLLEVCVSTNQEELDRFKLIDGNQTVLLKDLDAAREKIISEPNVPIKFVYFIISTTVNKALMASAIKIKNNRLEEYSKYYTIMNPPPELIKK